VRGVLVQALEQFLALLPPQPHHPAREPLAHEQALTARLRVPPHDRVRLSSKRIRGEGEGTVVLAR
jgi:hypothetical protein